jgi:SAM-dependent methyltransferase
MEWGLFPLPVDTELVRLDINPACEPDIVADMAAMGDIGEFDMVLSCHSLEHLYPHNVTRAVSEFWRVLKPDGHVVCLVPDLEDVRPTEAVVFVSQAGPITGLDIYYGHRASLEKEPHMAHHTGFTEATLRDAFAGFREVVTKRLPDHNLMVAARK